MSDQKSTKISDLFSKIVYQHQCMNLLPALSTLTKGYLESKLKVIIQERDEKRDEYLKT